MVLKRSSLSVLDYVTRTFKYQEDFNLCCLPGSDLWKRRIIYMIMSETNKVSSFEIISGKLSLSPWRTRVSENTFPPPFCFNGECIKAEFLIESHDDLWWFSQRIVSWWILFGFIIILTFGFIFLLKCFLKFRYSRNIGRERPRLLSGSHIIFFSPNDDDNVPGS